MVKSVIRGPTREKRDGVIGVIGHISKRENGNQMRKLYYGVIEQYGIQRDWVN